jgi:hypothetical protein
MKFLHNECMHYLSGNAIKQMTEIVQTDKIILCFSLFRFTNLPICPLFPFSLPLIIKMYISDKGD